jgi:hypothetical protein
MHLIRRTSVAIVGVVSIACASDSISAPPRGFAHAVASAACGPADGPAVAIYLAPDPVTSLEPATPFVRVYVAMPRDALSGHAWVLAGSKADGGAWFHSSVSKFEIATNGYMAVKSVGADNTIEGSVDIRFPTAGHIRGGFRAVWLPATMLCG